MRNDSLDDLSLKPSRDDLAQRQQRSPRQQSGPGKAPAPTVSVSTAPLWSLVVLLVVVMAVGGWYLWNQIQRLENDLHHSLSALSQSEVTLTSLQQNLDNRDKTLNKSGDQMAAELKELNSEVRKLWDVANKRNKALIDEQAKAIAALETSLKTQSANVDKQIQAATAGTKDLKADWQKVKDAQAELQTALSAQTSAMEKQKSDLAALKSSVSSLKSNLAAPHDLDDRITNLEVALKSIDAYRRQVNVRLDQLDQQLGQMYNSQGTR